MSAVRIVLQIRKLPHFHLRTCEEHFHNMYCHGPESQDSTNIANDFQTDNTHRGVAKIYNTFSVPQKANIAADLNIILFKMVVKEDH